MKRSGRAAFAIVLVLGLAISSAACHRNRGGDGGDGAGGTAITNAAQGRQAASSSMQAASMVQGSSTVFLNLASVGMSATGAGAPRDGDGVCDIGLDFDNTLGFGPEHITATRLPAGYYVLSVDDFSSSDAEVPVTVSVQIGGSLFGPFTHTFTAADIIADADGVNPAAWFAVADMIVDGAGLVTVKAHDPALELWHDGAFGMPAPTRAKGL